MTNEIRYSGVSAVPSDYDCPDGDLDIAINLIPEEDGVIKPLAPPSVVMKIGSGYNVEYVHKTSSFTHYIVVDPATNEVSWADHAAINPTTHVPGMLYSLHSFPGSSILRIDSLGNTLIVLTSKGMNYFLWKPENSNYLFLGSHIPECRLSFGLQGELKREDSFSIEWDDPIHIGYKEHDQFLLSQTQKNQITPKVLGHVNKFIAENSTASGKFMFPFFVRYAYRLYDGSLTMHSAPVLMVCSTDLAPQCIFEITSDFFDYGFFKSATLRLAAVFCQLDYAASGIDTLRQWSDIVKSVDVFISRPIYTYDQNGLCTQFVSTGKSDSYTICRHTNQHPDLDFDYPLRYQKYTFTQLYAMTFEPQQLSGPSWRLMLPTRDVEAVKTDIASTSLFYLLKSIPLDNLKTTRTLIPIDKEYLSSLPAREVMTDDYDSHDTLVPSYSFPYNSRLNIAGIQKKLFSGFRADAMFPFTDGCVHAFTDMDPTDIDRKVSVSVRVFIRQDGKEIVVDGGSAQFGIMTPFLWIYYPNTNAYKAVVTIYDAFSTHYEVPLEPHPALNGAYYFKGWEGLNASGIPSAPQVASPTADDKNIISLPNKIYTSEVNNPFFFPLLGINTVGTGNILAICSAVRALSQGQFGQFPLYAFSTEGVWALEVGKDGFYSARQPVARDVCVNPDSITQTDHAVLFATSRGIMMLSGSEVRCITDPLDSPSVPTLSPLKDADDILALAGLPASCASLVPFRQFLKGCGIVYDYPGRKILLFNPSCAYAYVYSLKSGRWGMMQSSLKKAVNSYPDALAVDGSSFLVSISPAPYAVPVCGFILSRPLKLGDPDILKTVQTIVQRGIFPKGSVKVALYGSRDLALWYLVASSSSHKITAFSGSPYKYFRLVIISSLHAGESLSRAQIQFYPRLTNRLR